jgi:Holliday junction DNA helicase RuvA
MIGLLSGTVIGVESDTVLLDVSGVGFEVRMPSADLASLHAGSPAQIFTTMNVSQDAITLFGFLSRSSKQLFIRLQKVSGIGPKVALSLLSTLRPEQLIASIEAGDSGALAKAPGLGRKGAQKIILELAGRLEVPERATGDSEEKLDSGSQQVVQGLVSLGWQMRDAEQAVQNVCRDGEYALPLSTQDIPKVLKLALTSLDRGR